MILPKWTFSPSAVDAVTGIAVRDVDISQKLFDVMMWHTNLPDVDNDYDADDSTVSTMVSTGLSHSQTSVNICLKKTNYPFFDSFFRSCVLPSSKSYFVVTDHHHFNEGNNRRSCLLLIAPKTWFGF